MQSYVDHDFGPGAADLTCGPLSSDGHGGTDFALSSRAAQRAGVDVLAASPGTVIPLAEATGDTAACAPGIAIDHGAGWQSLYCELAEGSITEVTGRRVAAGTVLGQVGDGSEGPFPRLHFELRLDGAPVDPFHPSGIVLCQGESQGQLWRPELPYVPGGLVAAGLTEGASDAEAIFEGISKQDTLPATADRLSLWVSLFGLRAGDEIRLVLWGPGGLSISETFTLDAPAAALAHALLWPRPASGWPAGIYSGTAELRRDGGLIDSRAVSAQLGG